MGSNKVFTNGKPWFDTDGNIIQAHGGCVLEVDDWFYWYGEDRRENFYVNCYRSKNLTDWEHRNHILTTNSERTATWNLADLTLVRGDNVDYGQRHELCIEAEDIYKKVNIERPKVIYNKKTKKYVMWAHYENGVNYDCAAVAIATCDTPDGDFVYHGSFRPLGNMSRDCNVYQEADGTAYFISTGNHNADTFIYRLTEDYLGIDCLVNRIFIGAYREAPVLFKHHDRYYIINSLCTGWEPNQCKYSTAETIDGEWDELKDCADATTFDTQPAFIIQLNGANGETVLYMGDRWNGGEYFSSTYVVLPFEFGKNGELDFTFFEKFTVDVEKGSYTGL